MTSLHRRFPGWASHDPESAPLYPTAVAMHFTTARPLEVRLRIPLSLVLPDQAEPGQWATWPCDRAMLKASCWVVGSKFGIGDVRVGMPNVHHWLAELRPHETGLRVAVGTHAAYVREFVADAERIAPMGEEHIDVDALISSVLGGAS